MQDIERAIKSNKKLKENDCNMVDNVLNNGAGEKVQRASQKARPVEKWQK